MKRPHVALSLVLGTMIAAMQVSGLVAGRAGIASELHGACEHFPCPAPPSAAEPSDRKTAGPEELDLAQETDNPSGAEADNLSGEEFDEAEAVANDNSDEAANEAEAIANGNSGEESTPESELADNEEPANNEELADTNDETYEEYGYDEYIYEYEYGYEYGYQDQSNETEEELAHDEQVETFEEVTSAAEIEANPSEHVEDDVPMKSDVFVSEEQVATPDEYVAPEAANDFTDEIVSYGVDEPVTVADMEKKQAANDDLPKAEPVEVAVEDANACEDEFCDYDCGEYDCYDGCGDFSCSDFDACELPNEYELTAEEQAAAGDDLPPGEDLPSLAEVEESAADVAADDKAAEAYGEYGYDDFNYDDYGYDYEDYLDAYGYEFRTDEPVVEAPVDNKVEEKAEEANAEMTELDEVLAEIAADKPIAAIEPADELMDDCRHSLGQHAVLEMNDENDGLSNEPAKKQDVKEVAEEVDVLENETVQIDDPNYGLPPAPPAADAISVEADSGKEEIVELISPMVPAPVAQEYRPMTEIATWAVQQAGDSLRRASEGLGQLAEQLPAELVEQAPAEQPVPTQAPVKAAEREEIDGYIGL